MGGGPRDEYDLVILGWGAAAFSAAIRASELTFGQAKIAMVGIGPLGGTCVNFGCVPSKYLIEAARIAHEREDPRYPGIPPAQRRVDFAALMRSLRDEVEAERRLKYEDVIAGYDNVDLVEGTASFTGDDAVSVRPPRGGTNLRIRGYNFLVATGSRPAVPELKGLREHGYLTSEAIWTLDELPGELIVIGGGGVGVEMGQAFSRLGSGVTIVEAAERLLPRAEPELSIELSRALESEGVRVLTGSRIVRVERRGGGTTLLLEDGGALRAEELLVAVGRIPNVEGLNLEAAGVEYTGRGIKVDPTMRTTNPRIYAAGDVVDQELMLETLAAREGVVAAENIYGHAGRRVDPLTVPWAIFTDPQLASVGYTEERCAAHLGGCASRSVGLGALPRGRIMRRNVGAFKVVASGGRVVGVHALAPDAAEVISGAAIAVRLGMTLDDVVDSAHVFPTISEGVKLAAQSFIRDVSRMSCCME